eukprot:247405-Amphidinium_carterae.2
MTIRLAKNQQEQVRSAKSYRRVSVRMWLLLTVAHTSRSGLLLHGLSSLLSSSAQSQGHPLVGACMSISAYLGASSRGCGKSKRKKPRRQFLEFGHMCTGTNGKRHAHKTQAPQFLGKANIVGSVEQ